MLVEGISAADLQASAIATLIAGNTGAGPRVYEAKDWPTDPKLFPMMLVHVPHERKQSLGRGIFQFNTSMTLVVVARVVDISAAANVESALRLLQTEIESALLGTLSFGRPIQQFLSIETRLAVTSEGKNFIGEIGMTLEAEVYQVYGPNDSVPLVQVHGTITNMQNGETLTEFDVPLPTP